MDNPDNPSHRILRRPEVEKRTGHARSTIYLHVKKGLFPAPVKIGPRSVGWRESDIATWEASLPTAGGKSKADEAA